VNFKPVGVCNVQEKPSFLVLLYGTLEYDGRAQRMLEILKDLGRVTIVDLSSQGTNNSGVMKDVRRIQVQLPKQASKSGRHLHFWRTVIQVARRERPMIVIAENYFTTLPGWISARCCGSKLIYDAYELIIPDNTYRMSKRDRFWYMLERWVIHRADLVIAANEERAHLMAEHYNLNQTPVVMRNIPAFRKPAISKEDVLHRFPMLSRSRSDEVLVIYQGDVSLSRGIGRFVKAFSYLGPEYRIVIVGGGQDLERIKELGQSLESEGRLVTLGRVEHKALPAITAIADVGIVTYPFQGLNNIYCASNKIFEYAQAGLPVVATDQPPLRRLVENYGIGKLIGEHDGAEKVANAIREVAENKNEYVKNLGRLLDDYCFENEAKRVRVAIDNIIGKSRRA